MSCPIERRRFFVQIDSAAFKLGNLIMRHFKSTLVAILTYLLATTASFSQSARTDGGLTCSVHSSGGTILQDRNGYVAGTYDAAPSACPRTIRSLAASAVGRVRSFADSFHLAAIVSHPAVRSVGGHAARWGIGAGAGAVSTAAAPVVAVAVSAYSFFEIGSYAYRWLTE